MASAELRASFDDEIKLDSGDRAVIRYVGEIQGKTGVFFGVELRNGAGKNNGSVQGTQYFICKFKRKDPSGQPLKTGAFLRKERIARVTTKSRNMPDLCVGDRVQVNSSKFRGTGFVRYIGVPGSRPTPQGIRVGVELDTRTRGGTDGNLKGQPGFFTCADGRGVYVRVDEVTVERQPASSRRGRSSVSSVSSMAPPRKKNAHQRSRSAGRGGSGSGRGKGGRSSPPRKKGGHSRTGSVTDRIAAMQAMLGTGIEETKENEPTKKKKKKKKKKKAHQRAASEMPAWKIKQLQQEKRRAELAAQAPVNSPSYEETKDSDDDPDDDEKVMSLKERMAAYAHDATVGVEEAAARRVQKRPSIQNLEIDVGQKQRARELLEQRVQTQATTPNAMAMIYEDGDDDTPTSMGIGIADADRGRARSRSKKKGHRRAQSRFRVEDVDLNDAKLVMTQFGFFQPKAKVPEKKRGRRTRSTTRAPNPGLTPPAMLTPADTGGDDSLFAIPEPLVVLNMNNTDMLKKMGAAEKIAMTRLVAHSIVQSPDLEQIQMCNAAVDDEFLSLLLDTLSEHHDNLHVSEMWLESNPIGNEGFSRLAEFLAVDDRIEVWKFQRNQKDIATDVIDALLTAIEGNERIVKFEFEFRFTDMRDRCERQLRRNQEAKRLRRLAAKRAAEAEAAASAATEED